MKNLNRHSTEEDVQWQINIRYLISLTIKEMQIKAIMRNYHIPTKMAKIKNAESIKCQRGYGMI